MNRSPVSAIMGRERGNRMLQEAESAIDRGLVRELGAAAATGVTESGTACRNRAECMRLLLRMDSLQLSALRAAVRKASEG